MAAKKSTQVSPFDKIRKELAAKFKPSTTPYSVQKLVTRTLEKIQTLEIALESLRKIKLETSEEVVLQETPENKTDE
jgi:hypothetical protein